MSAIASCVVGQTWEFLGMIVKHENETEDTHTDSDTGYSSKLYHLQYRKLCSSCFEEEFPEV